MSTNMITGKDYRITVLTDRLIRLEHQKDGCFEDRNTMVVVNRCFDEVSVSIEKEDGLLVVETKELILKYDEQEFTTKGLTIFVKSTGKTWYYGMGHGNDDGNLRGTTRTLDGADGAVDLWPGIFGRYGYATLDDSKSPVFDENVGEYLNRENDIIDIYFFGYGNDYYGGLSAFYKLSGKTPLVPRYALGNWWSRYFKYTEESYTKVLDNFEKENIPLSVAVIDMDWHITDIDPKYGTGWTGYTWNKEYFPDYKRFLKMLHDRKMAVTLNLHPADGIRASEEMYPRVAEKMGIDPKTEEPVEFDFGDKKFRDVYFKEIMHPYEQDGVDFWWIDWQQGTGKPGAVDPLFLLNHYHYKDQEQRNTRPMIFSRFAGAGSHRYPIGFSGDTKMTWKSLDFQPYFTSTASNIGYGWWSHDIGGHMLGEKNDERLIRWIEYGVFSPIMRLHSSNSPFLNKEPWMIKEPYHSAMVKFLRLRHALVPYLYTENYRAYSEDKPLIRPMYYDFADDERAYGVPNEYGFGDSLIALAITKPMDDETKLSSVNALIPKGRWIDILNGRIYDVKETVKRKLYREIDEIPVLLSAGKIVPMATEIGVNGTDNPKCMDIYVGSGADGEYVIYEDDGTTMDYTKGKSVRTKISVKDSLDYQKLSNTEIEIGKPEGCQELIPDGRTFNIHLLGVDIDNPEITIDKGSVSFYYNYDKKDLVISLDETASKDGVKLRISGIKLAKNDYEKQVFDILESAWIDTVTKESIYYAVRGLDEKDFLTWLKESDVSETLKDAITEIFM